mmetsp:Transcript_93492/g.273746  ORF Transcript_93492/g.273746 Transcript_93492/m.273746 type:complete len:261 (-) Transcript_93492:91-873(-)
MHRPIVEEHHVFQSNAKPGCDLPEMPLLGTAVDLGLRHAVPHLPAAADLELPKQLIRPSRLAAARGYGNASAQEARLRQDGLPDRRHVSKQGHPLALPTQCCARVVLGVVGEGGAGLQVLQLRCPHAVVQIEDKALWDLAPVDKGRAAEAEARALHKSPTSMLLVGAGLKLHPQATAWTSPGVPCRLDTCANLPFQPNDLARGWVSRPLEEDGRSGAGVGLSTLGIPRNQEPLWRPDSWGEGHLVHASCHFPSGLRSSVG